MYKKTKLFLIISILLLVSCNLREINHSEKEITIIKHKILENCNEESYNEYSTYIGKNDSIIYIEVLPYALKMMEVKGSDSQFDFFVNFLRIRFNGRYNPNNLSKLAKPEQDLLIYYLEEGSKDSSDSCKGIISDYYRKGIYYKKDVKKADSIYMATYGQPYPNKTI